MIFHRVGAFAFDPENAAALIFRLTMTIILLISSCLIRKKKRLQHLKKNVGVRPMTFATATYRMPPEGWLGKRPSSGDRKNKKQFVMHWFGHVENG